MYFLTAMLVGFLSIMIPSLIGVMVNSEDKSRKLILSLVFGIIYGLILWLVFWKASIGIYGPAPLFAWICIGALISMVTCMNHGYNTELSSGFSGLIIAILCIIIPIGILIFAQSDMFHSKEKLSLIGKVQEITELEKIMAPVDPAHICLVSEDMAKVSAQNGLSKFKVAGDVIAGSRYQIGEPTKQFVSGQLWWIFPVEFQSWLKWKQDPQVPGYIRVSAENPYEEAQAVQYNSTGDEIHIEYLNSACFSHKAKRYLRNNGYFGKILMDWTFEPDDNWNPHYTVSLVERKFGYAGYVVTHIVDLDLQTGKINKIPIEELPDWIDRVIPLNVIDYNVKRWGLFKNSTWGYNFWHKDKSQKPTEGWFMTYGQEGECLWFSGFTSQSDADQALVGFTVTSARTGQTTFFKSGGVTEIIAYKTAKSLWSNFDGYEPKELVPYNIDGILTYVIPMSYSGQYKGVSLVSLTNINIKAKGEGFDEALENFRRALNSADANRLSPSGGELMVVSLKGIVDRIGFPIVRDNGQVYPFMLDGVDKIFQVSNGFKTPEILVIQNGDTVEITYKDTREKIIMCDQFDIVSISLSDENPSQVRYLENQEKVGQEIDRINVEEKKDKLLNSDRLKDVDPDKLEEFLKNQDE
jgi:hypothetical protein